VGRCGPILISTPAGVIPEGVAPAFLSKEKSMYNEETIPWRVVEDGKTAEDEDVFDEDGDVVIAPYRGIHIVSSGGRPVAEFIDDMEDAKRIVACVNACKGVPTEALECQAKKDISARLIALNREVLASLDGCVTQIEQMRGMFDDSDGAIKAALDDAYRVFRLAEGVLV
jgi:hypothetical protein